MNFTVIKIKSYSHSEPFFFLKRGYSGEFPLPGRGHNGSVGWSVSFDSILLCGRGRLSDSGSGGGRVMMIVQQSYDRLPFFPILTPLGTETVPVLPAPEE